MSYLKDPIHAKNSCFNVMRYLEKDDRFLARDLFNCGDELEDPKGRTWAKQMDDTRELFEHNKRKNARSYTHMIISPDPVDNIDLEVFREIVGEWVEKHLPDYQIAIVYQDDNASGITHAHLIVNSSNLASGAKLSTELTHAKYRRMKRHLNKLFEERGLHSFPKSLERIKGEAEKTAQELAYVDYLCDIEKEDIRKANVLHSQGQKSWIDDISKRAFGALSAAESVEDFFEKCAEVGIEVLENRRGEYKYVLLEEKPCGDIGRSKQVGAGHSQISGALTKSEVAKHFGLDDVAQASVAKRTGHTTTQSSFKTFEERQMGLEGRYVWVDDLRSRVKLAKEISFSQASFSKALDAAGISVRTNKESEYVYAFKDKETQQVRGHRLGDDFTRYKIITDFAHQGDYTPPREAVLAGVRHFTESVKTGDGVKQAGFYDPKSGVSLSDFCKSVGLIVDYEITHQGEVVAYTKAGARYEQKSEAAQSLYRDFETAQEVTAAYDLVDQATDDFSVELGVAAAAVRFREAVAISDAERVKARRATGDKHHKKASDFKKATGRSGWDYSDTEGGGAYGKTSESDVKDIGQGK